MSSESTAMRQDIVPPQPIILKGFRSEPLQLLAIYDRGDAIELARETADEPMPFHADSVFEYDAALYAELRRAADLHDEQKLGRAWERATPFRRIA